MSVRVTTAAQAAAIDARAIAAGTSSWNLMSAAGTVAAKILCERFAAAASRGVVIFAGSGNNGGDGYVVAATLAAAGIPVSVQAVGEPRSADARQARVNTTTLIRAASSGAAEGERVTGLVVDALLGTGGVGAPRADVAAAIAQINEARAAGATVVSLDTPSGVDATSGDAAGPFVRAHLTVTFGTIKRGLLRNRDAAGAICVVDIGLGDAAGSDGLDLIDVAEAFDAVPSIPANANKGSRRRLLIIGGAPGMAGAAILAARGALRSGIGMVKVSADPASVPVIQSAEPAAMTTPWPNSDAALGEQLAWAQGVLIGPGLGVAEASCALALKVLRAWRGPVAVDADALTAFEGRPEALGELLGGRPAVITPHVVEAHRLAGVTAADLDAGRFEAADRLADRVRATVLLKGVPTVVSDGRRSVVVASGTPVLATGGSGDLLAGIVATLLTQTNDARRSAATAAWVHGRAAELAGAGRVRGVALDDVVLALRDAWTRPQALRCPILAELASVAAS